MQKVDEDKDQLEFTMEDVLNGTAVEAISKSKAEKLKKAIQNDNFQELLQVLKFFRKRLSFADRDNLICAQVRQLDLLPDIVCILKKFQFVNDDNRPIFEEASWAMANFCSGTPQNIDALLHHEFFEVAVDIFEQSTEVELFQNVNCVY